MCEACYSVGNVWESLRDFPPDSLLLVMSLLCVKNLIQLANKHSWATCYREVFTEIKNSGRPAFVCVISLKTLALNSLLLTPKSPTDRLGQSKLYSPSRQRLPEIPPRCHLAKVDRRMHKPCSLLIERQVIAFRILWLYSWIVHHDDVEQARFLLHHLQATSIYTTYS